MACGLCVALSKSINIRWIACFRCSFVTCLEHSQTIILSTSACKLLLTAVQDSMFDIKQNGEYNKERFGTEFDKQHPPICQSAVQSPIATTAGLSDSCTNSCASCLSFEFVCFPRFLFEQLNKHLLYYLSTLGGVFLYFKHKRITITTLYFIH